jgi:GINS complex subunit 2
MDPDELEFIGEKASIGIIPNFNFDALHLISGSIGEARKILFTVRD